MNKIKYVSILILLFITLTGCGEVKEENPIEQPQASLELKENLNVEINSEANLLSFVSENNQAEILSTDEKIDTTSLGEKELVIKYKDHEAEKEYTFKINIVDTTNPTIEYEKEITTIVGTKIDLLENVKITDNSNEEIKVSIEGDYNFQKEGTYKLKYVAVDSSNNKKEEEFVLKVEGKKTTPQTSSNQSTKPSNSTGSTTNKESVNVPTHDSNTKPSITVTPITPEKEEAKPEPSTTNKLTKNQLITSKSGKYKLNYKFSYVQQTDDFYAKNKQQIKNIIYTALNEGATEFKFYCEYDECIDDFLSLTQKENFLSYVNDYIHPYNTLSGMQTNYSTNYVIIKGKHVYSNDEINKIESKVNSIMNNISGSTKDKVKAIHDYLVNNTKYVNNNQSIDHRASGPLLNGKSVCDGYAQAMAIFLNRLNIPNYRISVVGVHGWNLAYIDGKWSHIDVTWDDPIAKNASTGEVIDILRHDYFLINYQTLQKLDVNGAHNFNKKIYPEA